MENPTEANPCDTDGVAHTFDLVLERVLDAPPEAVFRAWTDSAILSQWFAPKPWTITDMVLEPRPGGRFNFVMQGPEGERFPSSGIFLELVENCRIVSTDALTPDWKPTGAPFMVSRIELEPTADGRTRYTATASHWTEAAMKQHEEMGFHEGWGLAADQLNRIVKGL
jgi:uncharacterized protein YndB with AHSA1/START domain